RRVLFRSGVEVRDVDRGARLLAPRLVQPTGVDRVEAEFVDEPHDHALRRVVIPRHGESDAAGAAARLAAMHEVARLYVVERLDHRPPDLPLDPAALRHPLLGPRQPPIALWIVIAGLHDDDVVRPPLEEIRRE